ncbi:MAG: glycosyltransferase [bacterium]|nr:glycosyltransferase [bacterium]
MSMNAAFSIVIPVYNGESTLPDTLKSIQRVEGDFEFIVVDDGSTDRTAELAREAGARVVSMEKNSGPATARNRGGREAKNDIIVFTDSDVLVPRSLLQMLGKQFETSGADCVQGVFSDVCPFSNYFSQYKNLYNRYVLVQLPDWIDTTFTSLTAVKKSAFIACGGFDDNIRGASIEDRTLGRRLVRAGYRIRLDRSIEVVHNKRLTVRGFIRNQFRRSRDLAKFLLRNKFDSPPAKTAVQHAEKGRFGTNSLSTMLRLPLVYLILLFIAIGCFQPVFFSLGVAFACLYLYLILPFEMHLLRQRGLWFAMKGIPVNALDAVVSGFGVGLGMVEYLILKRKY